VAAGSRRGEGIGGTGWRERGLLQKMAYGVFFIKTTRFSSFFFFVLK